MANFDTIVFDVDGVLVDVRKSFTQAVKDLIRLYLGSSETDQKLEQHIETLRRVGGFNNDWDLAYCLTALLRERTDMLEMTDGTVLLDEIAFETGQRGIELIRSLVSASVFPDYEEVHATGQRIYWGANISDDSQFISKDHLDTKGLYLLERPFVSQEYFENLRALGVQKMGIVTGRNNNEVKYAMDILGFRNKSPFDVILTSEEYSKPDPSALTYMAEVLGTRNGAYVGDTRDDLQLVQNYSTSSQIGVAKFVSVMIAAGPTADYFNRIGADVVLKTVCDLPTLLDSTQA